MKKFISRISILLLAFLLVLGLISCDTTAEVTIEEITVTGIEIDSTSIPTNAVAGSLDLSELKLNVYWSNSTTTVVDVTLDMISINDRAKLYIAGQQQFNVIYNSCQTEFQIYLSVQSLEKYTLIIEGGVPVAIDDVTLIEVPTLTDGIYTAEYDEGTIVTVSWVSVEGYEFSHWTDFDVTQDTESTTNITMIRNHSYKAITSATVSVVNFYTNGATISTIAPKSTNILYESDINGGNVLIREDYVFDGWTKTAVGDGTEINCEEDKITFPYSVEIETTLYATWRPLGLTYLQKESDTGYIVTNYDLDLSDMLLAPTTLEIPSEYQGCDVVGIDVDAFTSEEASMLQYIYIPESVTEIDDGAFRNCSQLKTIKVNSTSSKFETLDGVLYSYGYDKLIAYPAGKIAVEYTIQNATKTIATYAFNDALLGSIVANENIETIGDYAFASAHIDRVNLSSVKVDSESVFGSNMFDSNLRKILVSTSYYNWYESSDCFSSVIDKITTSDAIYTEVSLGINTAKTILYRIVYSENSPTPQSAVEIIGVERTLTTITILPKLNGRNIFSIGVKAFSHCDYLETIIFPSDSNLERIKEDALTDTPWLASSLSNDSIVINNILYKYLGTTANYTLPRGIIKIAEGAFSDNETITSLNMSDNNELTFIGAYAFYNCINLSGDLEFMSNVVTIYDNAFQNTKISSVTLQEDSSLVTIGSEAFANCYYLQSVDLGANTEYIDSSAFAYCYSLEEFILQTEDGVTPSFAVYNDILYKCNSYGVANELFNYPAGKLMAQFNINEPDDGVSLTITSLGDYSLFFSNIASLYIPSTITSISTKAIYIPGLTFVEFEAPSNNLTYNNMFVSDPLGIGKYQPDYVVFNIVDTATNVPSTTESTNVSNFYSYDEDLKANLNFYNSNHTTFGYLDDDQYLLYAYDTTDLKLSVARSSRTEETLTIPTSCVDGNVKYIGNYAFYGYYLNTVITGSEIFGIEDYAFYCAENLAVLDLKSISGSTPSIEENTFNSTFNNGLLIYIVDGASDNYVDIWGASSKYLLEKGEGIANYVTNADEEWDTITYYADGSWKTVSSDSYTEQNIVEANYHPIPSRKGYIFEGWYDEDNNLIDSTEDYLIPYNIDLTACWKADVYTIVFKIGTNVVMETTEISISYDEAFDYDTPTYPNKNFLYWKDSTGKTYGQSTDETYKIWKTYIDGDTLILYPVWEDVMYRVVYDSTSLEGATCDTTPISIKYAADYVLDEPTKVGYVFIGWSLDEVVDGTVPVLITDQYGVSLDFWSLNDSLQYTVYPYFIAENEITVTLVIAKDESLQDIQYRVISDVVFGQTFTFEYLESYITDGSISDEYPEDLFCGWEDIYGVKYTDDSGEGLYTWNVATDTTLYAVWPELIESQEEFDLWLTEDDYLSESIALDCDITITEPIGDRNSPYTGVFIGNGYTVTLNYTVADVYSTNYDGYVGMVAYNKGTIKNVKLDANISILSTSSYKADLYLGGVAGINEGSIYSTSSDSATDINVSIFINFTCDEKYAYIGGIAGKNTGDIDNISCEINTITIEVLGVVYNGENASNIIAGSIVGYLAEGSVNTRSAKYYYNDSELLSDFGSYVDTTVISVNVTKTKIS
jgi:uncharacterized repeat protein (TIGR02543 family)